MREIKFRGWDKKYRRWSISAPTLIERFCSGLSDLDLMQYTGLKDKNGVEIYEGDYLDVKEFVGSAIGEVIWDYIQARFIFYNGIMWPLGEVANFPRTVEVISNIYENPELLGKNNEN